MKVIPLFKKQVIARAANGSRRAQQQLFQQYSPKMLSVCRIYIKDHHHAEEVLLGGFLKAFSHLQDYEGKGNFEGWLRKIMVRESISFLRSRKPLEFMEDLPQAVGESFNNVQADIDVEHIQRLIDDLPEGYRAVFVMYAIEGYKHKEIAEMLNIDLGTSKSQLFKARKLLQERLNTIKKTNYVTT